MKSTVTHTSQKLSGDMNSAHTPAGVLLNQKSFNLLSEEGERERERDYIRRRIWYLTRQEFEED
jgi:hypothetical protein